MNDSKTTVSKTDVSTSKTNVLLRTFGSGSGQLKYPRAAAVDIDGNYFWRVSRRT